MTSFLIGAQLFSMRDRTQTPEDLLATLKALKAVGYNSVQLSGQGAMPDEQIAGMLKETGMIAPGHAHFHGHVRKSPGRDDSPS